MNPKREDMDGSVPDQCGAALVLLDVINDLDFDSGEALLKNALPAARKLAELKRRAKEANVPSIYVNDNFGRWRSDFHQQLKHVLEEGSRGNPLAELLQPDEEDYFVLKPQNSGFYHTQLDLLMQYLGTQKVILTGFATDICVLFTASDAHMRNMEVIVPRDCVAANTTEDNTRALEHMSRVLDVEVVESVEIDFAKLSAKTGARR